MVNTNMYYSWVFSISIKFIFMLEVIILNIGITGTVAFLGILAAVFGVSAVCGESAVFRVSVGELDISLVIDLSVP